MTSNFINLFPNTASIFAINMRDVIMPTYPNAKLSLKKQIVCFYFQKFSKISSAKLFENKISTSGNNSFSFFCKDVLTVKKVHFSLICLKNEKNKKYNCSGHPIFKSQRAGYQSNQKLWHHC